MNLPYTLSPLGPCAVCRTENIHYLCKSTAVTERLFSKSNPCKLFSRFNTNILEMTWNKEMNIIVMAIQKMKQHKKMIFTYQGWHVVATRCGSINVCSHEVSLAIRTISQNTVFCIYRSHDYQNESHSAACLEVK